MTTYIPTPAEVAKTYLMARTVDAYGTRQGDFIDDVTEVGATEAQAAIEEATGEVLDAFTGPVPIDLVDQTKRAIMLLAAANIELSYFPEQASQANSSYQRLMERFRDKFDNLSSDVSAEEEENASGFDQGVWGAFPADGGWERRRW